MPAALPSLPTELRSVGVFSRGIARLPGLAAFLGAHRVVEQPGRRELGSLDAIVGWGHKPTARKARDVAKRHGVPYLALEDGFLRSIGIGQAEPTLSLVVDDLGIYYDATGRSRIEALLAAPEEDDPLADPALLDRARRCRERIVETKLSKYNNAPVRLPAHCKRDDRPAVLVVDQTFGDASVTLGLARPETFEAMITAACDENPDARIIAKVHPVTASKAKGGYLASMRLPERVERLADHVNPQLLLEQIDTLYVCSSQLGFEGVMAGKAVSCFGAPFYAGWGLTHDRLRMARRGRARTVDELVAAALLLYPRYLDPVTGERCDAEQVIEHLALQRQMFEKNARTHYCFGFSTWKRPFVRRFLQSPGEEVRFCRSAAALRLRRPSGPAAVVVWGATRRAPVVCTPDGEAFPVLRMEDGFLRSVGLGSDLTTPGSLVLDSQGLYYDPRTPSELERILQESSFSAEELELARRLRERIVALEISKYNPAAKRLYRPRGRAGQAVVLVPGQVEGDASVRLGSQAVRTNDDLLRAARELRPDAYLVYKPHPDVVVRNRRGNIKPGAGLSDEVVLDATLPACLAAASEVHTMTSLVGFEALLRGIPVVVHGQPFYAGWGLTEDRAPLARRTRRLSLDELVAGTLLRYPRYVVPGSSAFCTAPQAVEALAEHARRHVSHEPLTHRLTLPKRKVVRAIRWCASFLERST